MTCIQTVYPQTEMERRFLKYNGVVMPVILLDKNHPMTQPVAGLAEYVYWMSKTENG